MMISVQFIYETGISRDIFSKPRLRGSWSNGSYSNDWSETPMTRRTGVDGCPEFVASVQFNPNLTDWTFHWGVLADGPSGSDQWLIMTEVRELNSDRRVCSFKLPAGGGEQVCRLSLSRFLGAQRIEQAGQGRLRFAVWAPNARNVDVVIGKLWHKDDRHQNPIAALNAPGRANARSVPFIDIFGGYVADNGEGTLENHTFIEMTRQPDGIWVSDASLIFDDYDHRRTCTG